MILIIKRYLLWSKCPPISKLKFLCQCIQKLHTEEKIIILVPEITAAVTTVTIIQFTLRKFSFNIHEIFFTTEKFQCVSKLKIKEKIMVFPFFNVRVEINQLFINEFQLFFRKTRIRRKEMIKIFICHVYCPT